MNSRFMNMLEKGLAKGVFLIRIPCIFQKKGVCLRSIKRGNEVLPGQVDGDFRPSHTEPLKS